MLNVNLFNKKEVVAVALSGGEDSIFLAHLLHSKAKELGICVKAINVEHGIRGEQSKKDSEFVKDFCDKYGIELKCYTVNVPAYVKETGYSEEQAGRILRYECFDNALIEGFCDKIATAHHAGDNAEPVLFNILRGSALSGVCGISESAYNGKIIRPILKITKQEISAYLKEHNLPFVFDSTNSEEKYSRNYIRNRVLPIINERFESSEKAINRFSSLCKQDDELLLALAEDLVDKNSVRFTDKLHLPLFNRACLIVMNKLGITKDFESVHLEALYNLKNCQTGKRVQLKNGVVAYKSKDRVVFEKTNDADEYSFSITFPCEIETPSYLVKMQEVSKMEGEGLFFDAKMLPRTAVLRTKRTGDSILTFGGHNKSLKKFFNDKGIDARVYNRIPVIADGSEIYAVCGVDISKKLAVNNKTDKIIKLTCERKGD